MGNCLAGSNPALSAINTLFRFFKYTVKIMAVLDGELAVPCDLQTAYAGSIAFWRFSDFCYFLSKWC